MALVYLAVSFVASLAVSASVFQTFGSIALSIVAYGATGAIILFCVLLTALLREQPARTEPRVFAAE